MATIACEEMGKYFIVVSAIVDEARGIIDWKKFWKRLRNHKSKTSVINHLENIFVSSDDNFSLPEYVEESIPVLEEYKMAMLYSDMFMNNFFTPDEIVDENLTFQLIKLTQNRLNFIKSFPISDDKLRDIKKEDIEKFSHHLNSIKKART